MWHIRLTQEQFCENVRKIHGDKYTIVSEYKTNKDKVKVKHNKCGCVFEQTASKLTCSGSNVKCPCEYGRKFDRNINSIAIVDPDFAKLFYHKEDAWEHTINSTKSCDFVCPNCGSIIRDKVISSIHRRGLNCPYCSDNISFPEKIMCSFLDLNIKRLDNQKYLHNSSTSWSEKKRYDFIFYVDSQEIIVEMNGEQHYNQRENSKMCSNLKKQIENDNYKKRIALNNGISENNYIQIDCRYSEYNYIKENIINSKLRDIFDLHDFDWEKCLKNITTSKLFEVCEIYNNGVRSYDEFQKETGLSRTTVYKYLVSGSKLGICNYKNMCMTRVRCVNDNIVFDSLKDAGTYYHIKCYPNITKVCKKERKYCGRHPITNEPLIWEYAIEEV